MPLSIGIDLGGSHLGVGLVDTTGAIQDFKEIKIDNLASPATVLTLVSDTVKEVTKKAPSVSAVGIGLPGNHDSARGITRFSPNFPSWHNVSITDPLSKSLQLPVFMLNDVRAATLGELHFGAGKGVANLVMLAIGTGIGGGVVANRQLLIGPQEAAGEVGHMTIMPNGPLCNCGNRGCLEALASGPSIAARGAEAILHGRSPKLQERVTTLGDLSAKLISEVASGGDPEAARILEEAGDALGIGIANLAVILNPDLFILGGGVALAGKPLFDAIRRSLTKHLFMLKPETISIVPAALGVRAGLTGAAAYGFLRTNTPIP